ncbi:ead/Ea22-like family protein [Klebsiella quasipneumoniae]|uniref:ead/Ea22-like family protein n=1 Tax=Klebsiella quasipneumoniae TaxID=1463165 RepID=UPI0034D18DDE
MTDITELAQSLKAAAEKATQGNWRAFKCHDGRCGIGGGHHDEIMVCEHISKRRPHDAEFIALANPANILALVEALEKAQAVMNAVVTAAAIRGVRPFDGIDCDPPTLEENAEACGDAMSARIRELEANPPKPHHNGLMQISNELVSAKQRIAELESRLESADKLQDSAFRSGLQHGFSLGQTDDQKGYEQSMAAYSLAAGIKVEAE